MTSRPPGGRASEGQSRAISSRHNPRFKAAVALRERRGRDANGRFLIDGLREIRRALDAGVEVAEAFITPPPAHPPAQQLVARLSALGVPLWEVPNDLLARLSFGERVTGVVAVGLAQTKPLESLVLPEVPLVAVVTGVEKPGNLGAILRSADGAGISAVVSANPKTDLYNPNCIRASLGTVFSMRVAAAPPEEVLNWLLDRGLRVLATRPDARQDYTAVDLREPTALVLGAEDQGLSDRWRHPAVVPIRIPMLGRADSLNVSVAAAVLFYEALRQRSAAADSSHSNPSSPHAAHG